VPRFCIINTSPYKKKERREKGKGREGGIKIEVRSMRKQPEKSAMHDILRQNFTFA
jgi:hypothetical protein